MSAYEFYSWLLVFATTIATAIFLFIVQRYGEYLLVWLDMFFFVVMPLAFLAFLYVLYILADLFDEFIYYKKAEMAASLIALRQSTKIEREDKKLPLSRNFMLCDIAAAGQEFGIAFIAGQRVGKTYQAALVADMWLKAGKSVAVIGPKVIKKDWPCGCIFISGYDETNNALLQLMEEVERRHRDFDVSSRFLVILDDWTAVATRCQNASNAMVDACSLWLSAGVSFCVLLHADTSAAFGTDKKGAALKDNLTRVYMTATRGEDGQPIRNLTEASVVFPGESIPYPLILLARSRFSSWDSGYEYPLDFFSAEIFPSLEDKDKVQAITEEEIGIRNWLQENDGNWKQCKKQLSIKMASERFCKLFTKIKKEMCEAGNLKEV